MNIKRKCQVVMLPTNEQKKDGMICKDITEYDKIIAIKINNFMEHEDYVGQHLYITSDEEIKEGDWCLVVKSHKDLLKDDIFQYNDECSINHEYIKKIIATTDTSLISINEQYFDVNKSRKSAVLEQKTLPQPSQEFIRQYIEEYNKGNVIEFVDVEYTYDNGGIFVPMNTLYLLVNSDNTINIEPIKDSWSKEDVVALLYKSRFHKDSSDEKFDKWIEQNI